MQNSKLRVSLAGGTDGYMGKAMGLSFYPKYDLQSNDVSVRTTMTEISRNKVGGYKDNSGAHLCLKRDVSFLCIGIFGNYSGYNPDPAYPGWAYYNTYVGHRIAMYVVGGGNVTYYKEVKLDLNTLYSYDVKIYNNNGTWAVAYKDVSSSNWNSFNMSVFAPSSIVGYKPYIQTVTGDGGDTRQTGSIAMDFSNFAIENSLPNVTLPPVECPKSFTQTDLDNARSVGYQAGLAAAPKGFTQVELDAAKSAADTAGYNRGLAAAPKGFTQTQLDAAKKSGYDEGYNKGVADTTAKPPVNPPVNPTPVAPVITSVMPSALKEAQAILGDSTTWFSLTVKGSNFSNPAVFIPGVEQTLVSSTANEIVLQVKQVYGSSAEKQVPQGDRPVTVKNKDASNNVINEATKSGILTVTDRPVLPVVSPLATLPPPMFKFCAPATIENKPATHEGVDYKASLGDSVHSICDGTVKLNNTDELYGATHYDTQYGKYWNSFLIIKHNCNGDTVYGSYGHLKSSLSVGATVKAGDIIGSIRESYGKGDVRTVNNDHLHFGLSRKDPGTRGWGYSDGNLSCDAVKTNGWLDPETYLAFQQNATPTTKNNPKLMSPIDNTQNMSTNGVNLNWDLNNTATVSDVKLTLREAAGYNGTAGNYVGTCNTKSIGKVTSYSSNSCGALKPNQWYKWFVGLYFTDGLENNKGAEGYFMTAPTTTPALTLTALASSCPTTTLNSGGNATCKAIATYSDKSTKDVTASTTWSSNNTAALTVSQGNLVAGNVSQSTNVGITVSYTEKTTTKTSMLYVTVLKAVDTEKPKGSISPPISTSYTQGDQITVKWSATDNMQLAKVSFNVATGNTTPIPSLSTSVTSGWTDNGKKGSGVHYIDTSKLSGTYYYALWVRDATGNKQSYTGSFVVKEKPDTIKPTGQLTTSIKSSYVKGERVTIGWSASDNKQLAKVSFNIAPAGSNTPDSRVSMIPVTTGWKNNGTLGAGNYQLNTSLLTAGTYYYALWVKDAAGNEQSYNGSFTVTVPPPQVTGVSPSTVTYGKLTTFTVTGSNLPDTLAFYLKDCPNPTVVGSRSATMQKFSCTPSYTKGVKDGKVNDKTGGSTLKPFSVTVK